MEADLHTMGVAAGAACRTIYGSIVDGGLANGRTERRIAVIGIVSGFVALRQGMTSDTVYVDPLHAVSITVRIDPVSTQDFEAARASV